MCASSVLFRCFAYDRFLKDDIHKYICTPSSFFRRYVLVKEERHLLSLFSDTHSFFSLFGARARARWQGKSPKTRENPRTRRNYTTRERVYHTHIHTCITPTTRDRAHNYTHIRTYVYIVYVLFMNATIQEEFFSVSSKTGLS